MKTLTSRIKRRVLLLINNFKSDCAFSILYALLRVMDELCGRVHLNKLSNIAHEKKDKWILNYLERQLSDLIQKYKNIDDIGAYFSVSDVRNDVTGNWRISTIAEDIDIQEYALSYYKEYFKDDKEIHAIVNFNYKTTTKISVIGNTLDVSIYDYVDGEEHDAKLLFSGTLLKEYSVNMDNGSIEEIQ